MSFDFHFSQRVIFGEDSVDRVGAVACEYGASKRVLIVSDPGIVSAGYVQRVMEACSKVSLQAAVFTEVEENPTTKHVESGVDFARRNAPIDLIVAIGGGSAMDCAKGINFLLTNGGKMEDYWGLDRALKPMLPSIGLPTTAGTGSEAQSFALIGQEQTHRKMACGDKKARFRAVILDPVLTTTAPPYVTAVSGMDAITHAVESYVTTRRNALSQMLSREAWRLLSSNFPVVLAKPYDVTARGNVLLAAHLAGLAIEASMLGAAHACANPLTAHFGTTHGLAVGLMLPHVVRFNAPAVEPLYAELLQLAGVNPRPRNASEELSQFILSMLRQAALPRRLRDCSVRQDSIIQLAAEAEEQWTGKFNPVPVNKSDFQKLYETAY